MTDLAIDMAVVDDELREEGLPYLHQRKYLAKWSLLKETFPEFDRIRPWPRLHVEVGCGRALHLLELAPRNPDTFFLGIERVARRFRAASRRAEAAGVPNLLIVRRDVIPLVAFNFADNCVDRYDFFYPDPWPRHRHRRRRWYRHPFILEILRTLKPGGTLFFTSDQPAYVQEAAWLLVHRMGCGLVRLAPVSPESRRTHFEIKYLAQGRPLYELELRKSVGTFEG